MEPRRGGKACSISVAGLWLGLVLSARLVAGSGGQAATGPLAVTGEFAKEVLEKKDGANYCKVRLFELFLRFKISHRLWSA